MKTIHLIHGGFDFYLRNCTGTMTVKTNIFHLTGGNMSISHKVITHNLGFPRIGVRRELKHALEAYWAGKQSAQSLEDAGRELRACHWALQAQSGLEFVPVGDFAWYDQILEWTTLLGA